LVFVPYRQKFPMVAIADVSWKSQITCIIVMVVKSLDAYFVYLQRFLPYFVQIVWKVMVLDRIVAKSVSNAHVVLAPLVIFQ